MTPERIHEAFPAPSYRGTQRDALDRIREAFAAGNDVVLVRAPTGSGKSLLARAIAGCARRPDEAEPAQPVGAYYTTPQVSQLDAAAEDPLLEDLAVVRGKSNYRCLLPGERSTPVDRAPCAREAGYDCSVRHECPYFADRATAANAACAATTLAYFMRTAGSDVFRRRDVVVIDEAHGLGAWAETYATIRLNARRVPVWDDVRVPDVAAAEDPLDRTRRFAEALVGRCESAKDDLLAKRELTRSEVARRDRLQELVGELSYFLRDVADPESPTTWVVDADDGIAIKPLDPARHLQHTVWDRGERFALLSATILDRESFCRSVGLEPARVALVEVGHTFPVENRPLYDVTRGPMTYDERDETIPRIVRLLVRLMARHPDEKGIVHAHSYAIAERFAAGLSALGVGARVRTHDRDDRDAALADWLATDRPDVFVSVKMEEALDLEGDRARWQVVCKAPYRATSDSRVARRLEEGRWGWYRRDALSTVIQACGRVVRSPEDHGATYLADSSVLDLFDRAWRDLPDWFAAQVDRMSTPDLPPVDAAAALSGVSGSPGEDVASTDRSSTREDRSASSSHPLSDVWGDG